MRLRYRRVASVVVGLLILGASVIGASPRADAGERLYVTVDQSEFLDLPPEPFARVSVTNPNIAEVVVISPTQILINGKSPGTTSLLVFYPRKVRHFDLAVQPPPIRSGGFPGRNAETHPVVIQRADKVSTQLFARDPDTRWIELETKSEPQPEVKK